MEQNSHLCKEELYFMFFKSIQSAFVKPRESKRSDEDSCIQLIFLHIVPIIFLDGHFLLSSHVISRRALFT